MSSRINVSLPFCLLPSLSLRRKKERKYERKKESKQAQALSRDHAADTKSPWHLGIVPEENASKFLSSYSPPRALHLRKTWAHVKPSQVGSQGHHLNPGTLSGHNFLKSLPVELIQNRRLTLF